MPLVEDWRLTGAILCVILISTPSDIEKCMENLCQHVKVTLGQRSSNDTVVWQVELLEMVTSGIVAFFTAQPAMLDQVPQFGHIPKLFKAMSSRNDAIPKTALQIVQQLSSSEVWLGLLLIAVRCFIILRHFLTYLLFCCLPPASFLATV